MATICLLALALSGCGDRCETLCTDVGRAIEGCADVTFADVGAVGRADFVRQCRDQWDRTSAELTARENELALDVCADGSVSLGALTCSELAALYAPSGP